ncbi:hypothetical protein MBLNU230_g0479t1 [Neophaeotheca triangularis]
MAYASRNHALVEGLVSSISKQQPKDAAGFKQLRDTTARGLRDQSAARTNQFDVWSSLNGLVEKFGVLNREDLSDALQSRLDELPRQGSRWQPEILSLLLLLSDKPAEKANLSHLEDGTRHVTAPELTYTEIIAEDPFDEPGLWDEVERGYHSSGDEEHLEIESASSDSTRATSVSEEDIAITARSFVEPIQQDAIASSSAIERVSSNFETPLDSIVISELFAIRESLHLLRGLPTSLYHRNSSGAFAAKTNTCLSTAAHQTTQDVFRQVVDVANALLPLRGWLNERQYTPYLQRVQSLLAKMISDLDTRIAQYELQYTYPNDKTIASVVNMLDDARRLCRPLASISHVIHDSFEQGPQRPFYLLDRLYEGACTAQLAEEGEAFDAFAQLAWAGLTTYLKDVGVWIDHGELPPTNDDFFVHQANTSGELGDLYHGRFAVTELKGGRISAPKAFVPFVGRTFALGKSRAFLPALGWQGGEMSVDTTSRALLSFDLVRRDLEACPLRPFSQLVSQALDGWLGSAKQDYTATLRCRLLEGDGLLHRLDVFECACCSRDGVLFSSFADTLFDRIDRSHGDWQHRYLLTELARETLGSRDTVQAADVAVKISLPTNERPTSRNSVKTLECIRLQVNVPWHVQNITREETPESHANAFILLLQLHRAKYVLRRGIFDFRCSREQSARVVLRQCLVWLVDAILFHCTAVVRLLGSEVRNHLKVATDIDGMTAVYAAYKRRLNINLFVDPAFQPLRVAVTDVLDLCMQFQNTQDDDRTLEANSTDSTEPRTGLFVQGDADSDTASPSPRASVQEMRQQYTKLSSFLVAGIRGVGRSSGERMLQDLAERLEWGLG